MHRLFRQSAQSLASVDTLLPQYTAVDNSPHSESLISSDDVPDSPALAVSLSSGTLPRYSAIIIPSSCSLEPSRGRSMEGDSQDHQFEYAFPVRLNKPWCTLHLYTKEEIGGNLNASPAQPKIPWFWGGQSIRGVLVIDSRTTQIIQQITIRLRGKFVTSSLEGGSQTFLEQEIPLWRKGSGNAMGNTDGKFIGKHDFSFSIPFPTRFMIASSQPHSSQARESRHPSETIHPFTLGSSDFQSSRNAQSTQSPYHSALRLLDASDEVQEEEFFPTPPSFLESHIAANIQFEFSVHLDHGRFRSKSKIKTNITYVPSVITGSCPSARRAAIEARSFPPGPHLDPSGWVSLPGVTFKGSTYGVSSKEVTIDCKLYLAKPLSYLRGTFIPCYFDVGSEDSKALEELFTPQFPHVRLLRRIKYLEKAAVQTSSRDGLPQEFSSSLSETRGMFPMLALPASKTGERPSGDLKSELHEIGVGIWWVPPKDVTQESNLRHLQGEIHLSTALKPSCACNFFSIEYFVELVPFDPSIFKIVQSTSTQGHPGITRQALLAIPIEVATVSALDEPIPVPFSKPLKKTVAVKIRE